MRILLISNMYPTEKHPEYGVFVKNFFEQMSSTDVDVEKIVIEGRGQGAAEKWSKYCTFFRESSVALGSRDFDLIYVHGAGLSLLPLLWAKVREPVIVNVHGSDFLPTTLWGKIVKRFAIDILKRADLVVVPSIYFAQAVIATLGVGDDRVFVSPSGGIDISIFKPTIHSSCPHVLTYGYVSRIDEGKGWDVLLRAAVRLMNLGLKSFQLIIVGGGSQLEKMKMLIDELGMRSVVQVIGAAPHDSLPGYFYQMDALVFPTMLNESLGLVGLEAMACGVPVIGSDIGGLRSYIQPNKNGFLFRPGDDTDLADKMFGFAKLDETERANLKAGALNAVDGYRADVVTQSLVARLEAEVNRKRLVDL